MQKPASIQPITSPQKFGGDILFFNQLLSRDIRTLVPAYLPTALQPSGVTCHDCDFRHRRSRPTIYLAMRADWASRGFSETQAELDSRMMVHILHRGYPPKNDEINYLQHCYYRLWAMARRQVVLGVLFKCWTDLNTNGREQRRLTDSFGNIPGHSKIYQRKRCRKSENVAKRS